MKMPNIKEMSVIDKVLIIAVIFGVIVYTGLLENIKPLFDTPIVPFKEPYKIEYNSQVYSIANLSLGMIMTVLLFAWVFSKELFGEK